MPNGVSRGLGTIRALRLVENVSNMRSNRVETDRKHERNILIRAPDGEQTQNFDFTSREVVGKRHATVSGVQQSVDIDDQTRHFKSARELLGLVQILKALAPLCI